MHCVIYHSMHGMTTPWQCDIGVGLNKRREIATGASVHDDTIILCVDPRHFLVELEQYQQIN